MSEIPKEANDKMEREGWSSLDEQFAYWRKVSHTDIGGNEIPDRIEANEEKYGECQEGEYTHTDCWSLLDEGRSDGYGESYSERNS